MTLLIMVMLNYDDNKIRFSSQILFQGFNGRDV